MTATLFLPVPDSARLFAIDIGGPPCVRWVYENAVPLRTSPGYGELPGSKRKVLVSAISARTSTWSMR